MIKSSPEVLEGGLKTRGHVIETPIVTEFPTMGRITCDQTPHRGPGEGFDRTCHSISESMPRGPFREAALAWRFQMTVPHSMEAGTIFPSTMDNNNPTS